jgi:hypothetical protein
MGSILRRASATLFLPSEGMSGSMGCGCVPARRPCHENDTREGVQSLERYGYSISWVLIHMDNSYYMLIFPNSEWRL